MMTLILSILAACAIGIAASYIVAIPIGMIVDDPEIIRRLIQRQNKRLPNSIMSATTAVVMTSAPKVAGSAFVLRMTQPEAGVEKRVSPIRPTTGGTSNVITRTAA